MIIINKSILKEFYKEHPSESKKGDFGKLLIIGGSKKYSGSPALNAMAAIASLKSVTLWPASGPGVTEKISYSPVDLVPPLNRPSAVASSEVFLIAEVA